jgi:hypothetical protein
MMKIAALLSVVFLSFGAQAQQPNWPPLLDKGFISGHLASKQDVDNGNAVFAIQLAGTVIGAARCDSWPSRSARQ